MRLIIAGSRNFSDDDFMSDMLERTFVSHSFVLYESGKEPYYEVETVLCGGAKGADLLGKDWAEEHDIKVEEYPADWDRLGKQAGPIRNQHMVQKADALVAFWDGESLGTRDIISQALFKKLETHVFFFKHNL